MDHRKNNFLLPPLFTGRYAEENFYESPSTFLIANTPPYSPIGQRTFNFYASSSSSLLRVLLRKLMKFTCLTFLFCAVFVLLLSTSADSNGIGDRNDRSKSDKVKFSNDDRALRARRNYFLRKPSDSKKPTAQLLRRDGPMVDLGDGFAARGRDVLITVKTSKKYHDDRVRDIVETWFRLAPDQIYFVTDSEDETLNDLTGGRVVSTACPVGHHRQALCCKQAAEYETFLKRGGSWWCHFDDDNYVNVPQLMRALSQYDPNEDWYLGKPSTKGPIETLYRGASQMFPSLSSKDKVSFWFATGGAGFCVSKSLATKMIPYAGDGKFATLCDRIRLPDDVSMGFLIEVLLNTRLTVMSSFHSHLESMRLIPTDRLHEQVSLSAGSYDSKDQNLVNVDSYFSDTQDPRKFKSLHCHLYPMADVCVSNKARSSAER